jgi:hypothetical protein
MKSLDGQNVAKKQWPLSLPSTPGSVAVVMLANAGPITNKP